MKIVWRILIILLVGALIVGAAYGITRLSSSDVSAAAGGFNHGGAGGHGNSEGEGRGEGGLGAFESGHSTSIGGRFSTTLGNLGKIGIITVIVVAVSLVIDQIKRARHRRKAQTA
jgi:hypothetical protein